VHYPDTQKLNAAFCKDITANKKFVEYVRMLSPRDGTPPGKLPDTYTQQELMLVGSRFFLCEVKDKNVLNTTVCISLNDVEELEGDKDYTPLAAFCFEAIFTAMSKKGGDPEFRKHFSEYARENTKKATPASRNSETYAEDVKVATFHDMENDESLRKTLIEYYQANKSNISFQIL
jgi:hypothetical protein